MRCIMHALDYPKKKQERYNGRNNKLIQQISRLSIKAIPSISRATNNRIEKSRRKKSSYAIKCESRASRTRLSKHIERDPSESHTIYNRKKKEQNNDTPFLWYVPLFDVSQFRLLVVVDGHGNGAMKARVRPIQNAST